MRGPRSGGRRPGQDRACRRRTAGLAHDRSGRVRTLPGVPLLRDGRRSARLGVLRGSPAFSDQADRAAQTFADQAVIAIENVRLFNELQARTALRALEQQTATSEILRVISSSPTDVQPVLDAIVASARELCEAPTGDLRVQVDGEVLRLAPGTGGPTMAVSARVIPRRPARPVVARVCSSRARPDRTDGAADEFPADRASRGSAIARLGSAYRCCARVPRSARSWSCAARGRPFTDKQIELLKTFADQAVIAIENVRLFKELEREPRADRGARAADGDGRDPAGDQRARRPMSSRCSRRSPSAAPPVCGASDAIVELPSRGAAPPWWRTRDRRRARARSPAFRFAFAPIGRARSRGGPRRDDGHVIARSTTAADPTSSSPRRCSSERTRRHPTLLRGPAAARRGGRSAHRHRGAEPGRSPTSRSRCSRPSPTRRSSPSRTCGCSRSWRRATASSPRRWSSRRRPPRSCGSSPARRPISSRCSTRSPRSARPSVRRADRGRSSARLTDELLPALVGALHCGPHGGVVAARSRPRRGGRGRPGDPRRRRRSRPGRRLRPSSRCERARTRAGAARRMLAVPMLREGGADRRDLVGAIAPARSPTSRSRCSRPSPTRRSSPSRTCGCSQELQERNARADRGAGAADATARARSCG